MLAYKSTFPADLVTSYWARVRELLLTEHNCSPPVTTKAIKIFQERLRKAGVGDSVYHSTVEDTAEVIFSSGYVSLAKKSLQISTRSKLRKPVAIPGAKRKLSQPKKRPKAQNQLP